MKVGIAGIIPTIALVVAVAALLITATVGTIMYNVCQV